MSKRITPILDRLKYFSKREHFSDNWSEISPYSREMEQIYRRRWQHDKIVRSTHGVNCTGSCSWDVYVKDGIVTWEVQRTDYPSTGPDMPEYEPRGCPRGACFSWYIYSPMRVKYPYVRKSLLKLWREALDNGHDPVAAWESIVTDPEKSKMYKEARGKGGLIRVSNDEAFKISSAALIYSIKKYGPDRIYGVSPIPAMSMISYAAGTRFLSLLGSTLTSFYDWYADLPIASPQIWGDQTDVPESGDWYNSSYLMMWGSNIPQTRTPDAHFMSEVRYKGTKVVSVSPDYSEFVKFADNWLQVKAGTDAALAMAMGHVILKEFYIDKKTDYFNDYVKSYTDLPFLVLLKKDKNYYSPGRFLRASDIMQNVSNSEWKTIVYDDLSQSLSIPNGSVGFRWEEEGKWNLRLQNSENNQNIDPRLTMFGSHDDIVGVEFPYFGEEEKKLITRPIPVKKIMTGNEELYAATVYDLLLANYGLSHITEEIKESYNSDVPYTPAWQEKITGVDRKLVIRVAREFAQNAIDSKGRSMIIMGAGINHWYNSDTIYRAICNLVMLTGCEGVNGGGWAHYVGQEKLRPMEGWATIAFAKDWVVPPKMQNATSFYYFATDQWRYEGMDINEITSPAVDKARYSHCADYNVMAARLGWLPSFPQFDRNSIELYKDAVKDGAESPEEISKYVAKKLKNKELSFCIEDPDNEVNFPKVMMVWRANLLSSSGKGHEYFLKHLLGTENSVMNEDNNSVRPKEVKWREKGAEGKLDLLIDTDFRMSGTALYSDILFPTASWYEKHDLSSTDMHPFVHTFNPAVAPQWESQSDWKFFRELAKVFSEMAKQYFDGPVNEVYATPLFHDSPDEMAQPYGIVKDWTKGEGEPIPGKTMPRIQVVKRDYATVYDKMISLGPLVKEKPIVTKGIGFSGADEYEKLKNILGIVDREGPGKGCPDIGVDRNACEAVLMLSSTTNGHIALKEWEFMEKKTSQQNLKEYAIERAEERFTFEEITARPKTVITSPVFTGSEKGGRRYSPFTTFVESRLPWHTLTGRQHFFLDHEVIQEFGEYFAVFKPTLMHPPFEPTGNRPKNRGKELTLNYLTPHNKWSIHTTYFDIPEMLTLFRGGPAIWLNNLDAKEGEIEDNDWIECFNRNGMVLARAVVSHRIPRGSALMYHAQDRTINVPVTETTNTRGGTHNSPTRIFMKPTHMIGGYSQLSYDFNYYGTTGSQRDISVVIRKLLESDWNED